jgi:hypothetical protein
MNEVSCHGNETGEGKSQKESPAKELDTEVYQVIQADYEADSASHYGTS